jgi:glycogen operon protein
MTGSLRIAGWGIQTMVRSLHAAGLEVILDVVYNHTAEGNHLGPTLSFRGIDNTTYYRLEPGQASRYQDFTGTGNTLNMQSPQVLQLMMDSLRYWVQEMHVDGFRFDLASALARELHAVNRLGSFFDVIQQDPVISRVKLIAEPWDGGEGGYQVGNFPPGWAEWNGRYRDAVRRFWRGDSGTLRELATRLAGRGPVWAIRPAATCEHQLRDVAMDSLADLVAYERNCAAGSEDNRDGDSNNLNWVRNRRTHHRPEHPRASAAAAAQLPGDAAGLSGRAHALGRRRSRPQPGRQ